MTDGAPFLLTERGGPTGLRRLFSFSGTSGQRQYAKTMACTFVISFLVGPALGFLGLMALWAGHVWLMVPVAVIGWLAQLVAMVATAACVTRRCRDAFGKVLMPLAALLGFFVAPFFLLAFVSPLLPQGLASVLRGEGLGSAVLAGTALSLVTFAPGLTWLGMQRGEAKSGLDPFP